MRRHPPKLAQRIFGWYCKNHLYDSILGDLDEQFYQNLEKYGPTKARIWYWLGVITFINRFTLKKERQPYSHSYYSTYMIKNYILTSWRSLKKKPGFTFINVLGLSIGLASCLLIYMYVDYESSYDHFQDDNVYRMWINRVYPEREVNYPYAPHSFGPQLVEDFPEVIAQGRAFRPFNPSTVRIGDRSFLEDKIVIADSTFLQVMNIPLLVGDPLTALDETNALVLSESTAKKLFGDEDPIGKNVEAFGQSYQVTAVAADYPNNSHFLFDYLTPMHQNNFYNQPNWVGFSAMIYLKLQEGTDPSLVEEKLPAFVKQYAEGPIQQRLGVSYDEYIAAGNGYNYQLQHIKDIHLHSNLENEMKANGNILYLYIFSAIAVFILVIAAVNFMNLSTARSTERGKEVGVRKVLGAFKKQLIGQYLTESVMITIISTVVAIILVALVRSSFIQFSGVPISFYQLLNPATLFFILPIVLIIGLLSGLYPAYVITSFKPLSVLAGKLRSGKGSIRFRNALVVVQFTISIILISATLVVFDQMSYLLNKSLGYEQDQIIVLENVGVLNAQAGGNDRFYTFREELEKLPEVVSAAFTSTMPGDLTGDFVAKIPGKGEKESMVMRQMVFDETLQATLGFQQSEGRFFDESYEDSLSMILNESAVQALGIEEPIGKQIIEINGNNEIIYTIIGVLKDFHFQSLHVDLKPAAYTSLRGPNQNFSKIAIKVDGNTAESLANIKQVWNEFAKGAPFTSYFLNDDLERFYQSERTTGRVFSIFTFLAILISCIGLLGLSAYMINQRVKEIGVRKVLGSSTFQIVTLLSKEVLKLILFAGVIATPIAFLWMSSWLENFAYAVSINWAIFIGSLAFAILIGICVVGIQSLRAALTNPVESLRDD